MGESWKGRHGCGRMQMRERKMTPLVRGALPRALVLLLLYYICQKMKYYMRKIGYGSQSSVIKVRLSTMYPGTTAVK